MKIKAKQKTSLEVQWLRLHLPVQGANSISGVWAKICLTAKKPKKKKKQKPIKQKQYCNTLNEGFYKESASKNSLKKRKSFKHIDMFFPIVPIVRSFQPPFLDSCWLSFGLKPRKS